MEVMADGMGFRRTFGPILDLHAGFDAVDVAVLDWVMALVRVVLIWPTGN